MARLPTRNLNLPKGMRARHRGNRIHYYLDTGEKPRREIPLGNDYVAAVAKWAKETKQGTAGAVVTFRAVAERYTREVLPNKAPATQEINLRELANLLKFFADPKESIESITPVMVRQYLAWRVAGVVADLHAKNEERVATGREPLKVSASAGQVPANREKALFSHIWNFARETGLTNMANPCGGIKGFTEKGRDIYIEDDVLAAVYEAAEPPLRDALDLAYLVGQRPADVLKMTRADVKDGALALRQNKTNKKVRVRIEGEFAEFMDRINSRKVTSLRLINNKDGLPLTRYELRGAFDRARIAAAAAHPDLAKDIKAFQFRDLRAKAGTDKEEAEGIQAAQDQLGHTTQAMTAHYVRHRRGKLVNPTK